MDLNNVTVEMRPRSEWEAVDFGARLIRRDAAAIYKIWFAITIPMLLLAALGIAYGPYPGLASLLYWWFEPLADGPILRVISRRLFGENADVRATLRATPFLTLRNYIFLLPPYRFHMARSTAMPITQLEGLRGAQRRNRAKVLNIKIANHGMGVTVAYQHLVLALYLGIYLIVFALIPTPYQHSIGEAWLELPLGDGERTVMLLSLAIFYVAQTALQPWFVGAGFGLYINCRTQLEAWDIEVAFRRMVQRRSGSLAATAVALLAVLPLAFTSGPTLAQEDDPGFSGYWNEQETHTALNAALQNEALSTTRTNEVWRRINDGPDDDDVSSESASWFADFMRGIGKFLSVLVEFSLWIFVAILIGLVYITRRYWLPYVGFSLPQRAARRRVILSSGEVKAESLPADIPTEVARLWRDNKKRDALSLLYRGSVFAAVANHGVRLPASATEGLCLEAVQQQTDSGRAGFFARIVNAWILCAYGFRNPGDDEVLSLCAGWQQTFGAPQ